jgi:hypothetical protein
VLCGFTVIVTVELELRTPGEVRGARECVAVDEEEWRGVHSKLLTLLPVSLDQRFETMAVER